MIFFFNKISSTFKTDLSVFKNYTFYIFSNSLSILIPILVSPILIKNYNLRDFGYMMLIQSTMLFFSLLFDNGLRLFYIRSISVNRENKIELKQNYHDFLNIKFIFAIIFTLFFLLTVNYIVPLEYKLLCVYSLFIFWGNILNPVFFLIGVEKFTIVSTFNALSRFLYLLFFLTIINDKKHIYLNNLFFGISYCLTALFMFIYINKHYGLKFKFQFNIKKFITQLKSALPLIINNIYQNTDVYLHNFVIGLLAKNNELGLFTAIEKFYSMFKQGIIALIEILYPKVCNTINKKKSNQSLKNVILLLNLFFILVYILVFIFKDKISIYLTRDPGKTQENLLLLFMLIPFFILNFNFKSHLELMALKLDYYLSKVTLYMLFFKCFLFVLLYKFIGLYGIVITLLLTEIFTGWAKSIKVKYTLDLNE